jgi:hypothetical protein
MKNMIFGTLSLMLIATSAFGYSNSSNTFRNLETISASWGTNDAVIQQHIEGRDKIVRITATNNLSAQEDFTDEDQDATYLLETALGCRLDVKVSIVKSDLRQMHSQRVVEVLKASKECKAK